MSFNVAQRLTQVLLAATAAVTSLGAAATAFDVDLNSYVPDTTSYHDLRHVGDEFLQTTSGSRLIRITGDGNISWSTNQAGENSTGQALRVGSDGSVFYLRLVASLPFGQWRTTLTRLDNGAPTWVKDAILPATSTSELRLELLPDQQVLVAVDASAAVYDGAGNLLRTHALVAGRRISGLATHDSNGNYALQSYSLSLPTDARVHAYTNTGSLQFERALDRSGVIALPQGSDELLSFSGGANCSEPARVERIDATGALAGSFTLSTPACSQRILRSATVATSPTGMVAVVYPTTTSDGRWGSQLATFNSAGTQAFTLASEFFAPGNDFLPPRGRIEFLDNGRILISVARPAGSSGTTPSGEATVVQADGTILRRKSVLGSDLMEVIGASFDGELSIFGRHPSNDSIARLRTNRAGGWSVVFDAVHSKAPSWPFAGGRVGSGFLALYGNLQELRMARFSGAGLLLSNERLHAGETHGARMTKGGGNIHFLAYTAQESAGNTLYLRRYEGEALTRASSLPQFPQSVFANALWPTSDGGLALITSHGEPPYFRYHRLNANLDVVDSGALPWRQGFQGIAPTTGSEPYVMLDSTAIDTCVLREHDGNTLATIAEVPFACPGAMIRYGFLGKEAGSYRVAALSGGQLRLLRIGANGDVQSNTLLGEVPFAANARVRGSSEQHGNWVWVQNSLQQSGGMLFGLTADQQAVAMPLESRDCIDVATDASGGVRLLCFVAGYDLELRSYGATGALIDQEWLGVAYNNGFTDMHAPDDSSVFVQYQLVDDQVTSLSRFSFRDARLHTDGFEDTSR